MRGASLTEEELAEDFLTDLAWDLLERLVMTSSSTISAPPYIVRKLKTMMVRASKKPKTAPRVAPTTAPGLGLLLRLAYVVGITNICSCLLMAVNAVRAAAERSALRLASERASALEVDCARVWARYMMRAKMEVRGVLSGLEALAKRWCRWRACVGGPSAIVGAMTAGCY